MTDLVEALKKQIAEIDNLKNLPSSEDPKFKAWLQLTKAIVLKKFGGNKWQEQDCDFWPGFIGPWESDELQSALLHGLDCMKAFLETLIREHELFGDEMQKEKGIEPVMRLGEAGRLGGGGGGGSIFIQAGTFHNNGGKISADGGSGNYQQGEKIAYQNISIVPEVAAQVENLKKISDAVALSDWSEEDKLQVIGDIETIKAQVVKPKPNFDIVKAAWGGMDKASKIAGAIQFIFLVKGFFGF